MLKFIGRRNIVGGMISVTVLAKNSAKYLTQVLDALRPFDEVVLYDTGSTDDTLAIARRYPNVAVHQGSFEGFGVTHNKASAVARNDWILSIDSDEVVTPALVQEIASLKLDTSAVYSVCRHNYYNGRWIRWCGWYPDRQIKLYHRGTTRFSEAKVHEAVEVRNCRLLLLKAPVNHYPYACVADFLQKMQLYSELFAQQYASKRKSSVCKAVLHGAFAFFKSYILKRGFLGGREGFIISAYNGHTAYYKYLKLLERNRGP